MKGAAGASPVSRGRTGGPRSAPPRRGRRHGFNLVGLILVLVLLAGTGGAIWHLARQSGRSSHWFLLAQQATALADAGLKEAMVLLERENGPGEALADLVADMLAGGSPANRSLFEGSSGLPSGLQAVVDRLAAADFPASVTAEVSARDLGPLATGPLDGIAADPKERRGRITLTCRAEVGHVLGLRVARTAILERRYRVVGLVPPLVGRFVLFAGSRGSDEVNALEQQAEANRSSPDSGETVRAGGPEPLVVIAGAKAAAVTGRDLDRDAFLAGLAGDGTLLDRQGWIYLGPGPGGEAWNLKLAHGFLGAGESFLLDSAERSVKYLGDDGAESGFRQRIVATFAAQDNQCIPAFDLPQTGLWHLHHGFVSNWETIGIGAPRMVQDAIGNRTKYRFPDEDGKASVLRLLGTPEEASPTLVFGPVDRSFVQKAAIRLRLSQCRFNGVQFIPVYLPTEYPPRAGAIVKNAFNLPPDTEFQTEGTAIRREPYLVSLLQMLVPGDKGTWDAKGVLMPTGTAAPGSASPIGSGLVPAFSSLPAPGAPGSEAVVDAAYRGELAVDGLFTGNLGTGLAAFERALDAKRVFTVPADRRAEVFPARVLGTDGALRLPGILLVKGTAELPVPAIGSVTEGGILIAEGPLRITGAIARGGNEPLTLVSLTGDISIDPGVGTIEAYLAAPRGRVRFPGADLIVKGGLAGSELDLAGLTGPKVRIEYDPVYDPLRSGRDDYRVFYGDEGTAPRLALGGGGGG